MLIARLSSPLASVIGFLTSLTIDDMSASRLSEKSFASLERALDLAIGSALQAIWALRDFETNASRFDMNFYRFLIVG
jgi:hypothetical protein